MIKKTDEKNYHFCEKNGSATIVFTETKDSDAIEYLKNIVKHPGEWRFEYVSDMDGDEDMSYELDE